MSGLNWTIGDIDEMKNYDVFTTKTIRKIAPDGDKASFTKICMKNAVAVMVFNTMTKKFVLVKEWKHGLDKVLVECYTDLIEDNEESADAALKIVENKLKCTNARIAAQLFSGSMNPDLSDMHIDGYLVFVDSRESSNNLPYTEVIELPEEEMFQTIAEADSAIWQKLMLFNYTAILRKVAEVQKVKTEDLEKL